MSLHLSWIEKSQWDNLLASSGLLGGKPPSAKVFPSSTPPPSRVSAKRVAESALLKPSLKGTLEQRLAQFFRWLKEVTDTEEIFIADEHGLSIIADDKTADLSAASSSAFRCMETFKQLTGSKDCEIMTLILSDRRYLQIIGGRITWGWFNVGLITTSPMSFNAIKQVRDVFIHDALAPEDQGDLNE